MSQIYEEVDPVYAKKCSSVTLCSNTVGFFKNLSEEIVALAEEDDWLKSFEKVEDAEKVSTVMKNKTIMECLMEVFSRIQPLHRGKDAKVSQEKRKAVEDSIKQGDLEKCLALASQAVLRSPMTGAEEVIDGGVSLALALWTRSEVLLRLNRHRAALEDLKLALKERLPARMRAQYYWRMGHCYKGAGEPTRAKVSYELAGRLLGNNEKVKGQLQKDIDSLDLSIKPNCSHTKSGITLTGGAKQSMPSLSKLLKITEDEIKGRFAVANEPVKTGNVLLIDSPYAACLLPDFYGTNCLHCFKRLDDCEECAPVWCPQCSEVAFCSLKCRDIAITTYHSYECPFLGLFFGSGMSILSHIALRMVTQAGLEASLTIYSKHLFNKMETVESVTLHDIEGTQRKLKMKSRRERLNRSKKILYPIDDNTSKEKEISTTSDEKQNSHEQLVFRAAQVYSLCTHSRQRKGDDYLKRIVMAMFLTECLKRSDFFKNCEKDKILKAEVSICELIVCNLQLLQFNAHEIYETIRGQHMFTGSKPVYTAVGIYPTGALFNHECNPAVARYFDGRNIVLRATRPLAAGEIVSENYGPHFLMRNLKERQRCLACRYWFKCDCVACKEDWPTLKQMNASAPFLRCPNISCSWKFIANQKSLPSRCSKCSVPIERNLVKVYLETVDSCLSKYEEGARLMEAERPMEAIDVLCEAVDMYHEVARMPHRETHIAQESLRSCFATFGNVHIVKTPSLDETKENN
ncbi:unnamed protein product, partial [Iphiclides podalirius]